MATVPKSTEDVKGRPMKGYVTLPKGWRSAEENARGWVELALAATSAVPPKVPMARKRK